MSYEFVNHHFEAKKAAPCEAAFLLERYAKSVQRFLAKYRDKQNLEHDGGLT
jgi:hypothetical protein